MSTFAVPRVEIARRLLRDRNAASQTAAVARDRSETVEKSVATVGQRSADVIRRTVGYLDVISACLGAARTALTGGERGIGTVCRWTLDRAACQLTDCGVQCIGQALASLTDCTTDAATPHRVRAAAVSTRQS